MNLRRTIAIQVPDGPRLICWRPTLADKLRFGEASAEFRDQLAAVEAMPEGIERDAASVAAFEVMHDAQRDLLASCLRRVVEADIDGGKGATHKVGPDNVAEVYEALREGIEEELPRAVTRLLQAGTVTAAEGN